MDISAFKTNFQGGTRSNRFLVSGAIGAGTYMTHTFHVRSTFIPTVAHNVLEMNAYGRKLNIPGDRQYGPWQITVYDDVETSTTAATSDPRNLWELFSLWHDGINQHADNMIGSGYGPLDSDYKANWTIEQLDINGDVIKTFELLGCWPKSVGDIDFNMTRRNFLNTFSVILLYDEIRIDGVTP